MQHPTPQEKRQALIAQIDALVQESCRLKRSPQSWSRHVEIQAEIMRLCRLAADHFAGDAPYWMDEAPPEAPARPDAEATTRAA